MPDIWQQCDGERFIGLIEGELCRVVESQEQIATLNYVDSFEEQALLESLLDQSKPAHPEPDLALHYLLKTPFRYPPLKWGSRFGTRSEPSLFYGARSLETALAETSYYRWLFLFSMETRLDKPLRTEHTSFYAEFASTKGIRLNSPPFLEHLNHLSDPSDYQASQTLGKAARDAGVEVIIYQSARCPKQGECAALLYPRVLVSQKPERLEEWFCDTRETSVTFKSRRNQRDLIKFKIADFLVKNRLPQAAD